MISRMATAAMSMPIWETPAQVSSLKVWEPPSAPADAPIMITGNRRWPLFTLKQSAAKAQNWAITMTPKMPTNT